MILDLPIRLAEYTTPEAAFENLSQFVYDLREQLDMILENLEMSAQSMSNDASAFTGQLLCLTGKNGAYFKAGQEKSGGPLSFELVNEGGRKLMFMSGDKLVVDRDVVVHIDGGIWG